MARSVVALYDDFMTAKRVVEELVTAGVERHNVSLVANDSAGEYSAYTADHVDAVHDDVSGEEGAGFGAVIGALVGIGALAIPGIGPVIAGGPLVAALTGATLGAAAGAAAGGLTASLVHFGVDENSAGYYAEGVRRGGTLVIVETSDTWNARVLEIMNRHNPTDINTRADSWREHGWTGFDAAAEPYTADDINREREAFRSSNMP